VITSVLVTGGGMTIIYSAVYYYFTALSNTAVTTSPISNVGPNEVTLESNEIIVEPNEVVLGSNEAVVEANRVVMGEASFYFDESAHVLEEIDHE
jgi:hypothetical protein